MVSQTCCQIALADSGTAPVSTTGYVDKTNRFGLSLFQSVASGRQNNTFVSPLSVAMALQMVYEGADGTTRQEMAKVLNLSGLTILQLNQACSKLDKILSAKNQNITLSIADALWSNQNVTFKKNYLAPIQQYFSASLHSANFTDPATMGSINSWCSQATQGKITQIINSLDANAIMVLLNAVYFKGLWTTPFQSANTKPSDFHLDSKNKISVPTMYIDDSSNDFSYGKGTNFEVVRLPYGPNQKMSMYVALPAQGVALSTFIKTLNYDTLNTTITNSYYPNEIILKLPKFKIAFDTDLGKVLSKMGMASAFDQGQANFSNMVDLGQGKNAYLSSVIHETYIDVDESGTVAAAVTAVEMLGSSAMPGGPPPPPIVVNVDHPFVFLIKDEGTGAIVFVGSVANPKGQ